MRQNELLVAILSGPWSWVEGRQLSIAPVFRRLYCCFQLTSGYQTSEQTSLLNQEEF